jgi:hypothetical protein
MRGTDGHSGQAARVYAACPLLRINMLTALFSDTRIGYGAVVRGRLAP